MKTLVASKEFSTEELIRRQEDHLVLIDRGRAVALVSRLDDDDVDWLDRELDPDFIESLARARRQVSEGQTRSLADVKIELGIVTE